MITIFLGILNMLLVAVCLYTIHPGLDLTGFWELAAYVAIVAALALAIIIDNEVNHK